MKRQLNTKLLAWLVIPTCLIAAGAFFLRNFLVEKNSQEYYERSKNAATDSEAVNNLERFLTYGSKGNENYNDALARYGYLLDKNAAGSRAVRGQAITAFEKALKGNRDATVKADSKDVAVRALLAEALVESNLNEEALIHLNRLIDGEDATSKPTDQEMSKYRLQRGQALLALKRYEADLDREQPGADVDFKQAIALDPTNIDAYYFQAVLLRENLKKPEEADAVIESAVAKNPESNRAYLARAFYRAQAGKTETDAQKVKILEKSAADDAAKAYELEPNDIRTIGLITYLELETNRPNIDRLRPILEKGIEAHPDNPQLYLLFASAELQQRQFQKAEEILLRGAQKLPASLDISWKLANLYLDTNQLSRAEAQIAKLSKSELPPPLIGLLNARLLAAKGDWESAVDALEPPRGVRPQLESTQAGQDWTQYAVLADITLARCYEQLSKKEPANKEYPSLILTTLRRAVQSDPASVPARLALATALSSQGQSDEAMRILSDIKTNSLEDLLNRARVAIASQTNIPAGQPHNWTSVEALVKQIEQEAPNSIESVLIRTSLEVAQGNRDQAKKRLEDARVKHPKSLELWIALSELARIAGKNSEAAQILEQAGNVLGDSPELFIARVAFWSRLDPNAARPALINMAPRIATYPSDRQALLTRMLAQALTATGANAEATDIWKALAANHETDLDVQVGLFDQAVRNDDDETMQLCVKRLKAIEGEDRGTLWRYAEAGRLVARARREDSQLESINAAKKLLEEIQKLRPGWSRIPLMRAEIAEIEKDPEAAIALYTEAIRGGERRANVIRRLVRLFYDQKQYDAADKTIKELLNLDPNGVNSFNRLKSEIRMQMDDKEGAAQLAGEAIAPDSQDYRDHVWLGRVYLAAGQAEAAEKAFRKAVEVARATPEPWIALFQFLSRSNRPKDAEETLKQAAAALPPNQAALILARGFESLGRTDEADALFKKAIGTNPKDVAILRAAAYYYLGQRRATEAETILRKIIDPATESPALDRTWARRLLALALMNTNTPANFKEAGELLEANQRDNPDAPDDLVAKALVLASQPDRAEDAIKTFERALKAGNIDPSHQVILARLYEKSGKWNDAKPPLLKLIEEHPNDPAYIVVYVQALTRNKEFDAALPWIEQLEKREPGSLRPVTLRAQFLKSQGKNKEAMDLLQSFATEHPADAPRVALILEGMSFTEAAEKVLRDAVTLSQKSAEAVLNLAAFFGRNQKLKEALELCESARKDIPAEVLIPKATQIISMGAASDDDFSRIERWIDEAEKTADRSNLAIRNMRGVLRTVQGQYREAEALYRKSIESDAKDYMALNNLAWLLALTGGNGDEALKAINQAIQAIGPHPALLDTRGVVYVARNEPALAINDLENAVGSTPEAVTYFHLARAHQANKNPDAARSALKKAVDRGISPSDIDSLERDAYAKLTTELASPIESDPKP